MNPEYRKQFYMYNYIFVCLWGDHFSEELNFEPRVGNGRHVHALHTQSQSCDNLVDYLQAKA